MHGCNVTDSVLCWKVEHIRTSTPVAKLGHSEASGESIKRCDHECSRLQHCTIGCDTAQQVATLCNTLQHMSTMPQHSTPWRVDQEDRFRVSSMGAHAAATRVGLGRIGRRAARRSLSSRRRRRRQQAFLALPWT